VLPILFHLHTLTHLVADPQAVNYIECSAPQQENLTYLFEEAARAALHALSVPMAEEIDLNDAPDMPSPMQDPGLGPECCVLQ
jgi:hypothetical protein